MNDKLLHTALAFVLDVYHEQTDLGKSGDAEYIRRTKTIIEEAKNAGLVTEHFSLPMLKIDTAKPALVATPALVPDKKNNGEEFVLAANHCWITVPNPFGDGGVSVYVKRTDEGVVIDLYPTGKEDEGVVASTYAFFAEG